jgi:nitrate/TMAO reductase-like tetraheme cytochrome c subunit
MDMTDDTQAKQGLSSRFWKRFMRPSARWGFATILVAGGVAALGLWGVFTTGMAYTNTPEFCMSCHEMADNVGAEWKQSVHYKSASGVRAGCADCHVPKELGPKLWRKIMAANDVYHHLLGTIDTPEKFEEHRAELAERVWARMEANDSRECRSCHSYEAMDFHKQTLRAQEKMKEGLEEGKTCIECHTGVAHKRPPRDD